MVQVRAGQQTTAVGRVSIMAAIDRIARSAGSSVAFVSDTDSITYGELAVSARQRGAALVRAHSPDRIGRAPLAVVSDGSVDSVISMIGVLASGHPLFAVDGDLPLVARNALVAAAGAVPAASVMFEDTPVPSATDDGVWWESPEWDRGMTEGGSPTALDSWRPALVVIGPGTSGRVTVTQEELMLAATDLGMRVGLAPGTGYDMSRPASTIAGFVSLVAGLVTGSTVGAMHDGTGGGTLLR
ncbi:hypothetical protein RU01_00785 [Rhodococcus sp. MEB064]|nr:hypothetical protein RU01_00785 [Rhodococcus sp. MEB064]